MTAKAQDMNPMYSGNWAPIDKEIGTECTNIIGTIPTDLAGSYIRNGPNDEFEPISIKDYHIFDGDGMIHQLEFKDGKAFYKNKWVETNALKMEREAQKSLWKGFKSPIDFNHESGIPVKHPANTGIIYHNGKLLALWEAGLPYVMTFPGLETEGETDFDGEWTDAFSAHPSIDPKNGDLVTFYYSPIAAPYVKYGVINKDGKVVHRTEIEIPKPVMIHDIAITPNYSIICDLPYVFSIERAMNGEYPFDWEPDNGSRIGLIGRYDEGSEIKWFDVAMGNIIHVINAYEEGDEVVFEACRSKRTSYVTDGEDYDPSSEQAHPWQYRFNLKSGEVKEKCLDEEIFVEFPRINDNYIGQYNRYTYALKFLPTTMPRFNAIVKYDRQTDERSVIELGELVYAIEFIFAPRIDAKDEDDGYLIGYIHDEVAGQSKTLIIDCKKFDDGPVATILMPQRVPYGFHSSWVPLHEYE